MPMMAMIIGMIEMRIPSRGTARRTCMVDGVACPLLVSVIHGLPPENPERVWSSWSGFLLLRGTGSWQAEGMEEIALSPGCFGQHPLGRWHRIRRNQSQNWVEISVRCPRVLYLHLAAAGILPIDPAVVMPSDADALQQALQRLMAMLSDRSVATPDCLAQLAVAGAAMQRVDSEAVGRPTVVGLDRARRELADDLLATIDLPAYARRMGLSYAHFRRVFTQAAGMPPASWRTKHRLEHARQLLRERGLTVIDAAAAVGYGSAAAFSRRFTQACGDSPSRVRAAGVATGTAASRPTLPPRDPA
jgi:AraC-like DNA-binding protein